MTRTELLAALEAVTGPSRELDAEIMFDLHAKPVGKMEDGGPRGYLWPEDNPSWLFGIRFPGKDREWFKSTRKGAGRETLLIERDGALVLMNELRIPPLTASIDAALTLVPEGHGWMIRHEHPDIMPSATVTRHKEWDVRVFVCDKAPTPALSLCIAAIRARGKG